jgi:DNA-binding transcriptional LysR family regulator
MDIKILEDFLQLAESGNFSRAAAERNVTQPAFSRRIKMLEIEVGVPLIDRSTYPTSLTLAGEAFRDAAAGIVERFQLAIETVRAENTRDDTTIKFAVSRSMSINFVPEWFTALSKHLESFNVHVHTDNLHNCIHALIEGDSHFMACFAHPSVPLGIRRKDYPCRILGHASLIPVSKADHEGVPWFELPGNSRRSVPYLAYSPDVYIGRVLEQVLGQREEELHSETVYRGEIPEALKQMAIAGHGVAFVPDRIVADELADGMLAHAGAHSYAVPLEIRVYGRGSFSDGVQQVLDTIIELEKARPQQ